MRARKYMLRIKSEFDGMEIPLQFNAAQSDGYMCARPSM